MKFLNTKLKNSLYFTIALYFTVAMFFISAILGLVGLPNLSAVSFIAGLGGWIYFIALLNRDNPPVKSAKKKSKKKSK